MLLPQSSEPPSTRNCRSVAVTGEWRRGSGGSSGCGGCGTSGFGCCGGICGCGGKSGFGGPGGSGGGIECAIRNGVAIGPVLRFWKFRGRASIFGCSGAHRIHLNVLPERTNKPKALLVEFSTNHDFINGGDGQSGVPCTGSSRGTLRGQR